MGIIPWAHDKWYQSWLFCGKENPWQRSTARKFSDLSGGVFSQGRRRWGDSKTWVFAVISIPRCGVVRGVPLEAILSIVKVSEQCWTMLCNGGVHNYRNPKCLATSRWKCNYRSSAVCCRGSWCGVNATWDSDGMLHGHPAMGAFAAGPIL